MITTSMHDKNFMPLEQLVFWDHFLELSPPVALWVEPVWRCSWGWSPRSAAFAPLPRWQQGWSSWLLPWRICQRHPLQPLWWSLLRGSWIFKCPKNYGKVHHKVFEVASERTFWFGWWDFFAPFWRERSMESCCRCWWPSRKWWQKLPPPRLSWSKNMSSWCLCPTCDIFWLVTGVFFNGMFTFGIFWSPCLESTNCSPVCLRLKQTRFHCEIYHYSKIIVIVR